MQAIATEYKGGQRFHVATPTKLDSPLGSYVGYTLVSRSVTAAANLWGGPTPYLPTS
jgi:hypothetical protein